MKNILAIAVATALIAPAAAMADTTLYGKLHASVGTVDNGADSQTVVESRASRFGIKGSTELDNGLSATYGLEYGLDIDGDNSRTLGARNTFAGVKGGFGEVRIGRHDTPAKLATAGLDAFADTYGQMEEVIGTDAHRVDNVVAYINKFGSFGFAAAHSTDPLDNDEDADDDNAANSVMLNYSTGPIYAGLGYTAIDNVATQVNVGASYKTEAGHFVNAVYEMSEGDGVDAPANDALGFPGGTAEDTSMYVAGGVKSGAMTFKAAYGNRETDGVAGEKEMTNVGVDYRLGKKTDAYVLWSDIEDTRAATAKEQTATVVGIVTEF